MKLETGNWKLALCLCALCGNAMAASTNLNYTAAQINAALGRALAITNTAQSAGVADVGFVNQGVATAFTNTTPTDIDLSAYVGTNAAVVGIVAHANSASTVLVRPNGRTNDVDATSATGVAIASGGDAYMVVSTDSSGVIEADVTASTDFTLLWFIRRREF